MSQPTPNFKDNIGIRDVLDALHIKYPTNKAAFYIPCPCCDTDGERHLNINVRKDVFRCPKCGVSGGMKDLYILFVPEAHGKNVFQIIRSEKGNFSPDSDFSDNYGNCNNNNLPDLPEEYPLNDTLTRHKTYSDLLNMLQLSSKHREDLRKRGLTDKQIDKLGYKTAPAVNQVFLCNCLQMKGDYLSGVPGFYKTPKNTWMFAKTKPGLLIPVRDHKGRIQGIQLRIDSSALEKSKGSKYRWISSAGMQDGCRAKAFFHLVGKNFQGNPLIITEGPIKADITHEILGMNVLAVPGVNAQKGLKNVLLFLKPSKIITAFDNDLYSNPFVKKAMENLTELLKSTNIPYSTYKWDRSYKGIDDFLAVQQQKAKAEKNKA